MASRQTDSGNGETAVPSANVRRRLAKLVARGIYPLMDFLEKESCDSGVMKQYEPFTPQQPLDTDGIVRQVIGRLKDELPATADRGRVEAEVRGILPAYNPNTHRQIVNIVGFLLNHLFDQSGCSIFFIEKRSDMENLNLMPSDKSPSRIIAANHSSHMDDILVGALSYVFGLGLGHFVAGANLMIVPEVERLMKELNVIKVKRSLVEEENAKLYRIILEKTCEILTDKGEDFIIFPEATMRRGARTRDGTLRAVRSLRVIRGITESAEDAMIIPIAVSYSRVPEYYKLVHGRGAYRFLRHSRHGFRLRRDYIQEQGAVRLLAHSLLMSYRGIYGRARASVGEPFSVKELISKHSGVTDPARLVADESMRRIAKVKKVMPSHIVAEAIRDKNRVSIPRILERIQVEIDKVIDYHRTAFGCEPNFSCEFDMGPRTVMEVGMRDLLLMRIIKRGRIFFKNGICVRDRAALAYYGKMTDHRLH